MACLTRLRLHNKALHRFAKIQKGAMNCLATKLHSYKPSPKEISKCFHCGGERRHSLSAHPPAYILVPILPLSKLSTAIVGKRKKAT